VGLPTLWPKLLLFRLVVWMTRWRENKQIFRTVSTRFGRNCFNCRNYTPKPRETSTSPTHTLNRPPWPLHAAHSVMLSTLSMYKRCTCPGKNPPTESKKRFHRQQCASCVRGHHQNQNRLVSPLISPFSPNLIRILCTK